MSNFWLYSPKSWKPNKVLTFCPGSRRPDKALDFKNKSPSNVYLLFMCLRLKVKGQKQSKQQHN